MTRNRIVVGVDGSDGGRHALAWAVGEAARRSATLEAVHVWSAPVAIAPLGAVALPGDEEAFEEAAHATLDALVADVADEALAAGVTIEEVVLQGHATTVLLERAEAADLLVVGSRGHGAFMGMLLGSIAHQCLHHATGPVAVVPLTAPVPADGLVVVGVDGSEEGWAAARWATEEAGIRDSRLLVVHGWWTPYAVPPVGLAIAPDDTLEFEEDARTMLRDMMDGIVEQAACKPAEVVLEPVEEVAAKAIIDRSEGAGMVVVGSRGRGGFKGLLLGSVSQQVVHHAHCATVVIR
jgi:nucleotide-binding universal stress UspA family protein